jgi:hypothetical protein
MNSGGDTATVQMGPSTFGVFDVFPDDAARDAHLAGGVGQALGPNTGVLFSEPGPSSRASGERARSVCAKTAYGRREPWPQEPTVGSQP